MKSIGEILTEARQTKKLTIEQVVNETHIPKQYILSLEADQFENISVGESNLLGFLRMYALFLGLDVDKILSMYKNYKLIEEQAPYEELLKKEINMKKILLRVGGGILLLFGLFFLLNQFFEINLFTVNQTVKLRSNKMKKTRKDILFNQELVLSVDGYLYYLKFSLSETQDIEGVIRGEDAYRDFLLSSEEPFSVVLNTLSFNVEVPATLRISYDKVYSDKRLSIYLEAENYVSLQDGDSIANSSTDRADNSIDLDVSIRQEREVLMSVRSSIPVNPIIMFKGYVNYRHRLDNSEVIDRYYQAGEQIQRTMHNNMKIWTSNAGRTTLKIGLNEIALGRDGEVAVKILYWQRNSTTGMLDLIIEDV
ncbi:helix-turn-helix domain-containing protein [Entomospira culicis]|uniref:Helix-turn-helix domain-containing protein n=1 Tax=Entomospira culicis TaxID=2719989 RepID=A0A968KUE1_9SPIO|nr:helix-turn-helix domain-containing protein [Entomospira culicis]NIZ19626.1 helix-turn-helix domain-containing protein [Entomospira culicis]NIZ69469.1 helix-turn-helix domain-containing protein [Entomospira culicis]WDI36584.1 helix-turn-helix domain-containing protein [Entomospira culicis]WDI38212.1 helix-turn-helix domain-containing protein [Entomospira culicis]